jgi:hypothetical protein
MWETVPPTLLPHPCPMNGVWRRRRPPISAPFPPCACETGHPTDEGNHTCPFAVWPPPRFASAQSGVSGVVVTGRSARIRAWTGRGAQAGATHAPRFWAPLTLSPCPHVCAKGSREWGRAQPQECHVNRGRGRVTMQGRA